MERFLDEKSNKFQKCLEISIIGLEFDEQDCFLLTIRDITDRITN